MISDDSTFLNYIFFSTGVIDCSVFGFCGVYCFYGGRLTLCVISMVCALWLMGSAYGTIYILVVSYYSTLLAVVMKSFS